MIKIEFYKDDFKVLVIEDLLRLDIIKIFELLLLRKVEIFGDFSLN